MYSKTLGKYYIGSTISLPERIQRHNLAFFGSKKFTASASDWEAFLSIECESIEMARKVESHIKRMKSVAYIQNLKKYPEMVNGLKLKYAK